jgi:hypothetical protein
MPIRPGRRGGVPPTTSGKTETTESSGGDRPHRYEKGAAMATWAYIYEHPATDPVADAAAVDRGGQRTLLVPVPAAAAAPGVARRLVDEEGAALIELCGGFTLADAARVVEAVGDRVPVGHVAFSAEAVRGAAAYGAAAEADTGGGTAG